MGYRLRLSALGMIDRHFVSSKTNRWLYPFNRATAEVEIDNRQRSDPRRILWFSGRVPSKSDSDRLDKGFQGLGLGALLGTFPAREKYPGVWGRVGPINTGGLTVPGPPRPGPGSLFPRRKSDQNAAGDTPAPVLPNRTPAMEHCAATETPRFGWSLVIGPVGY